MNYIFVIYFALSGLILLASGCGVDPEHSRQNLGDFLEKESQEETVELTCPLPKEPRSTSYPKPPIDKQFIDLTRPLRDLATDIVNQQFFKSPDSLFAFMNLVYTQIEQALIDYRAKNNIYDEKSISFLFKGGNVLRLVFNKVMELLPDNTKTLMSEYYKDYFKRSDADFTVYIDQNKIKNQFGDLLDYNKTYQEVSELLLNQLQKLRESFKSDANKYFDFTQLGQDLASDTLRDYFTKINELGLTQDEDNKKWFGSTFVQLQFSKGQANPNAECDYIGQHDYYTYFRDDKKNKKIVIREPLGKNPDWIALGNNQTLELLTGDGESLTKFALVRAKIFFDFLYIKKLKLNLASIGGELIDLSIPHRNSSNLQDFFDNYDKLVATYTLASPKTNQSFSMKAYSFAGLVEDLSFIVFDAYARPWEGGHKYSKRLYRLFFLLTFEMLDHYGIGSSESRTYLEQIKQDILEPAQNLFSQGQVNPDIAQEIQFNSQKLVADNQDLAEFNNFIRSFALFVTKLEKSPKNNDDKEFENFLNTVSENIDKALEISNLKKPDYEINNKIKIKNIYEVDIGDLI